ncbi:hypothetical protein Q8F55_003404 [Vanrija albida]|uniref:Uncharacterized protein n=1 Tax=Vanrija albida TaxID=181172 RepID=A0ABR3Q3W6_9TREE
MSHIAYMVVRQARHLDALDLAGIRHVDASRIAGHIGLEFASRTLMRVPIETYSSSAPNLPHLRYPLMWCFFTSDTVPVREAQSAGYRIYVTALHTLQLLGVKLEEEPFQFDVFCAAYHHYLHTHVWPMLETMSRLSAAPPVLYRRILYSIPE